MAVTRHKKQGHVVKTNVSEATRKMSMPPRGEVGTFYQEYVSLVARCKEIESHLQGYNKSAELKEQARVRRESNNNLHAWLKRKAEFGDERAELIKLKIKMENRLSSIKEIALQEQRAHETKNSPVTKQNDLLESILIELREIKSIVNRRNQ
jgi:hypothetical protein